MKDIYNLKVHYLYYHSKCWEMTTLMQRFFPAMPSTRTVCLSKGGTRRGQRLGVANRQEAAGERVATQRQSRIKAAAVDM